VNTIKPVIVATSSRESKSSPANGKQIMTIAVAALTAKRNLLRDRTPAKSLCTCDIEIKHMNSSALPKPAQ
jgi:hypothetical protein